MIFKAHAHMCMCVYIRMPGEEEMEKREWRRMGEGALTIVLRVGIGVGMHNIVV
jgi:hypothetical protein